MIGDFHFDDTRAEAITRLAKRVDILRWLGYPDTGIYACSWSTIEKVWKILLNEFNRWRLAEIIASGLPPQMQGIRVIINVFTCWWMILHNKIIVIPKQGFNFAHFIPGRASFYSRNANVLPSSAIRCLAK